MVKNSINYIKEVLRDSGLFMLNETEYETSESLLTLRDKEGFLYSLRFRQVKSKIGRNKFSIKNPYTIYNIKHYINIHNLPVSLLSTENGKTNDRLVFACECGKEFEKSWNHVKNGLYKCKDCAIKSRSDLKRNKLEEIKKAFILRGFYPMFQTYSNCQEKLTFMTKEGFLCETTYDNFRLMKKPLVFSTYNKYTIYNIKRYFDIYNLDSFFVSEEWKGANEEYLFRCKECGEEYTMNFQVFMARLNKKCRKCNKSISGLEIKTKRFLEEKNIKFETQKRFKDCKYKYTLPFDFYIPCFNCCIEVDGQQHFVENEFFGGEEGLLERRIKDSIKTEYCKKNGIELIRIPYWYFKNNTYIDFLKCKLNI